MKPTSDDVLTVQEVADYLKVTPKTVYTLVKAGSLSSFRIGRALRCRRVDVERFIADRRQPGGSADAQAETLG